ncbi:DnaJ-domain-containing protein [Neolentinus lepideus HHB14362 ss-1]|uniref:DnaJ-domain-containing protein n=1 Tax=Neolentinus lepideus HHB14362 ss-1 TaxID=1314782 RepID=A0A165N0W9_9AGAM|nr:DnaJ-domain-containing protein [Neolentinus lepideus HHB14362 ss-1]
MPASNPKDYHEVLQTRRDASLDEIRAAYKRMALKWHPDRHATDKELANDQFVEVYEAYRALTKKALRERHVRFSDEPLKPAGTTPPSPKANSEASTASTGSKRSSSTNPTRTDPVEKPKPDPDRLHSEKRPNPRSPPLRPVKNMIGASKEWIFPLALSLEELFHGTCQRYSISRHLLSGEAKTVIIDVDIPPGCRDGTQIRVPGVGNQRKDGTLQDIVFLVTQRDDSRFVREQDDLITNVQLPCRESSCYFEQDDVVYVEGINGHMYLIPVPLSASKATQDYRIKGAGMPIRRGGCVAGYGDLLIRWNLVCCHEPKIPPLKRKVLKRRHT